MKYFLEYQYHRVLKEEYYQIYEDLLENSLREGKILVQLVGIIYVTLLKSSQSFSSLILQLRWHTCIILNVVIYRHAIYHVKLKSIVFSILYNVLSTTFNKIYLFNFHLYQNVLIGRNKGKISWLMLSCAAIDHATIKKFVDSNCVQLDRWFL